MQRTSVNTQTLEPKCSSGVQTQGEKNSTRTMRKKSQKVEVVSEVKRGED
jgi:hypothetical protein